MPLLHASLRAMRPIFCGNFVYETRQSDLELLFSKYGIVQRIDMKSGFAFFYFEDERDAEDTIRGERDRHHDGRAAKNQRPTRTLFVIKFDPVRTREYDIERHFGPYGKVLNVRICWNFAFVQFETVEDVNRCSAVHPYEVLIIRMYFSLCFQ
ncbi:arginine/serine-rich splicing factor [Striga asiatica]|uniref:Arginine/serine-rich splicing factor n=1 Tax=Striga asiatica TaxID=4170 RepID=A0A5A7PWQ4_STRAF|nr:arginine/serine-rich splicing factor [Striga asiatica]